MLHHELAAPTPPPRVVVIGGHGFVGGAIAKRAQAAGLETLTIGRADVDLLAADAPSVLASHLRDGDCIVAASALAPCKNVDMLVENMVLVRAHPHGAIAHYGPRMSSISAPMPSMATEFLPLHEGHSPVTGFSLHGAMHLAREVAFQSSRDRAARHVASDRR